MSKFKLNSLTGLFDLIEDRNTLGLATTDSPVFVGVDLTDDVVIDLATRGLVLKDTQGTPHYWRLTVDNAGAIVTSDLGTGKP